MEKLCPQYKNYISLERRSFFLIFYLTRKYMKIIFKWSGTITQKEFLREFPVNKKFTIKR